MFTSQSSVYKLSTIAQDNNEFRQILHTNYHAQLVVMSLKPNQDIGLERHKVDQFFYILNGLAEIHIKNQSGEFYYDCQNGDGIMVAAGDWHNVTNVSNSSELKLITIYSPPEHTEVYKN